MLKYTLVTIAMLVLSSTVCASTMDWQWRFGRGYSAQFGTAVSALDGADASDARIGSTQYYYYGAYHERDTGGWTGDTGLYSTDIRAPLQLVPGQSKTWTFYLWADPSYPQGPPGDHLEMMWGWGQPSPAFSSMQYVLTYAASAQGVIGGTLPVGTSVPLNQYQQGTWSFPVYRTSDGRTGYRFNLTATVIPEPSSLAALSLGLLGAGAGVRWRRRE